jgi:hypothetical protein
LWNRICLVSAKELILIDSQGAVISIWRCGPHGPAAFEEVRSQCSKEFKEGLPVWAVGVHERRLSPERK